MDREFLARIELATAREMFKRAEREAKREKKPIPKRLYNKHMDAIRLAQRNLESAALTNAAMNQYPPVR